MQKRLWSQLTSGHPTDGNFFCSLKSFNIIFCLIKSSFLGMTAHWICPTTLVRMKATLICKRLIGRHTNDLLAVHMRATVDEFGITTKTTHTVTDAGSNFFAAFR